ncbi:nitronate monooxygenase [Paenibacillus sp. P26]|nr:nitronate monooxygenase [Paenibacillus sp. P26]
MKITLKTELCRRLGIRYPIILAGMAGGPTTAGLVASVSQAGGLGTLGAAYMNPDQIREAIREIRKITAAPFGVNLFADRSADDYRRFAEVKPVLNSRVLPSVSNRRIPRRRRRLTRWKSRSRCCWRSRCP